MTYAKKVIILLVLFLISGCVIGFLGWMFLSKDATISAEAKERYNTTIQISEQINEIIEPWVNKEGTFVYDEETLTEAAQAVYAYALELEESGIITGSAYCEEGYSVSFFLADGSTSVYLPSVEDFYSGGAFGVSVFDLTTWRDTNAGYTNPGDTITDAISEAWNQDYGNDTTVEELKEFLGSLNENQIRAIFWRGHGGIYTEDNGELVFVFGLNEEVTEETESLYAEDRVATSDGGPEIISVHSDETKYAINYRFIEKYTCNVEGGLFFTGSCYSGSDGGTMAMTLINKGFDAYVGANGAVNQWYSNSVLSRTAEYLSELENGYYIDLESALDRAVAYYEGANRDSLNDLLAGGEFVIAQQSVFRLVDPSIDVTLVTDRQNTDWGEISVHVLKTEEDGEMSSSYPQLSSIALQDGGFTIANAELNASYQIDVYYGSYLIKTVILDSLTERTYKDSITYETIELDPVWLNIILEDGEGKSIFDADIEIWANDDTNGVIGNVQEPVLSQNDAGDDVYQIILSPGEYFVKIETMDGWGTQDTVTVEEDMTLRYTTSTDASSAYAQIVRQYEEEYGELEFYEYDSSITRYTGVFLIDLVDFDQNGTDELVIGYSVPYPWEGGVEVTTLPSLDVWTLADGVPLCIYEHAYVQQSDVGQHCLYTYWNGEYYLVTGWSGSDVELELLKMDNGEFKADVTLRSEDSEPYVCYLGNEEIDTETFQTYYDQIYSLMSYNGNIYEWDNYTAQDLSDSLQEAKEQIGMTQ